MDTIEQILDKIGEWFRRLIEALLGTEQPESEPIPIPVRDSNQRR